MWINHEMGVFKVYFIFYLLLIMSNYLRKKLIFAHIFISIDPTARSSKAYASCISKQE